MSKFLYLMNFKCSKCGKRCPLAAKDIWEDKPDALFIHFLRYLRMKQPHAQIDTLAAKAARMWVAIPKVKLPKERFMKKALKAIKPKSAVVVRKTKASRPLAKNLRKPAAAKKVKVSIDRKNRISKEKPRRKWYDRNSLLYSPVPVRVPRKGIKGSYRKPKRCLG